MNFSLPSFGKASVIAAANLLEGELSGQFARGGDSRIDKDEAYIGWRNDTYSLSVGPRELMISDGFLIGDGNFDTGSEHPGSTEEEGCLRGIGALGDGGRSTTMGIEVVGRFELHLAVDHPPFGLPRTRDRPTA